MSEGHREPMNGVANMMPYHSFRAGMSLIFPYLTLQALGLGLTYEDISIIYGISPVIALAAGPIAGKQNQIPGIILCTYMR